MGLEKLRQKKASNSPLRKLRLQKGKRPHADRQEMDRILMLPFTEMLTPQETEEFSSDHVLATAFEDGFRLMQTQASAVHEYHQYGGGFDPIGVGWGKTGISLMCAEHAYQKGLAKILLLIEPGCLSQLVKVDIPYWRKRVSLSVPFHVVGGRGPKARRNYYQSGYRGCYIVPYSYLSVIDTLDMLEAIDPDLVIADEAHNLKDPSTARTKRFMEMMRARQRELVAMSGTITTKSLEDYRHLITLALRERSPLPLNGQLAYAWGRVLDSNGAVAGQNSAGPLIPLIQWAQHHYPKEVFRVTVSDLRRAFQYRLHSAPGVVATGDNEIKTSLSIENQPIEGYEQQPGWAKLSALMKRVQDDFITPNGDEIDCSIHVFKWMVELSAGVYNELIWPTPEVLSARTELDLDRARDALEEARGAHALSQLYHKELRTFFQTSCAGQDTPMQIARLINRDEVKELPDMLVRTYRAWHGMLAEIEEQFGFVPERDSRAVRVCPFKVQAACDWAKAQQGGAILWVYHRAMGQWVAEEMAKQGLDPLYCPAGANEQIIDPANKNRLIVASISAHGTGKNLQHFQRMYFVQWPRDSKKAEQTLGRLHRKGQEADHLAAISSNTLPYEHLLFAACLNDSIYQHQTGSRRKMVYATYDPLPKIFSPEFLKEQGANPKILNPLQRQMLEDKFGEDWQGSI